MIRAIWPEYCKTYGKATDILGLLYNLSQFFTQDLKTLQIGASKSDIEEMRERYCKIESIKEALDREVLALRGHQGPHQNLWLTERRETNQIYFAAMRLMLGSIKAYTVFLRNYQTLAFPIREPRVNVLTLVEQRHA